MTRWVSVDLVPVRAMARHPPTPVATHQDAGGLKAPHAWGAASASRNCRAAARHRAPRSPAPRPRRQIQHRARITEQNDRIGVAAPVNLATWAAGVRGDGRPGPGRARPRRSAGCGWRAAARGRIRHRLARGDGRARRRLVHEPEHADVGMSTRRAPPRAAARSDHATGHQGDVQHAH
jgi:hypothetical protein